MIVAGATKQKKKEWSKFSYGGAVLTKC